MKWDLFTKEAPPRPDLALAVAEACGVPPDAIRVFSLDEWRRMHGSTPPAPVVVLVSEEVGDLTCSFEVIAPRGLPCLRSDRDARAAIALLANRLGRAVYALEGKNEDPYWMREYSGDGRTRWVSLDPMRDDERDGDIIAYYFARDRPGEWEAIG